MDPDIRCYYWAVDLLVSWIATFPPHYCVQECASVSDGCFSPPGWIWARLTIVGKPVAQLILIKSDTKMCVEPSNHPCQGGEYQPFDFIDPPQVAVVSGEINLVHIMPQHQCWHVGRTGFMQRKGMEGKTDISKHMKVSVCSSATIIDWTHYLPLQTQGHWYSVAFRACKEI